MPIYEYKCTQCEHRLEKLQRMSDDPLKDCPECGNSTLAKLVSASSFKLKGTGWYETDFKNNKKSETTKTSEPKSSESKSKPVKTEKKSTDKAKN